MDKSQKKSILWRLPTTIASTLILMLAFFGADQTFSQPFSLNQIETRFTAPTHTSNSDVEVIGVPCGSGELMDPDTVCIHGRVLKLSNGTLEPINRAQVEISLDGQSVSGETFYHAGSAEPAYGLDISSLDPTFFEPVTVTVTSDNVQIQRQLIVFPNFDTHNQEFDIIISTSSAFDDRVLWGHVVDYEAQGPVSGAVVTVSYGSPAVQVTTITAEDPNESYPIYKVSAAELPGIAQGDRLTVTSEYQSEIATQTLTVSGDETQQKNIIIGWHCNDTDPFRNSGGTRFFPRNSGGTRFFPGFPNVMCIWGYSASNGSPQPGIEIEIESNGSFYRSETKYFPGEVTPRYGIALPNAEELVSKPITVTASLNGLSEQVVINVGSQDSPIKRADLNIIGVGILGNSVGANGISDLIWIDQEPILATTGGLVQWDLSEGSNTKYIKWTPQNSMLPSFDVEQILKDSKNNIYTKTERDGIKHYHRYDPSTQTWHEVDLETQHPENFQFSTDAKDQVWISDHSGYYQLDDDSDKWRFFSRFDEEVGLGEGQISDYVVDSKGGVWFITFAHGFKHYNNQTQNWTIFNAENSSLPDNKLYSIDIGSDDVIWIGTQENGVVKYDPNNQTFQNLTVENSDLLVNGSPIIKVGPEGNIYITSVGGVQELNPETGIWIKLDTTNTKLFDYQLSETFFAPSGEFWLTSNLGLFRREEDDSYTHFQITDDGPIGNRAYNIFEAENGIVWFATKEGLSRYDPITGEWTSFTPLNSSIPEFTVWSVASVSDGIIWAGLGDHIWEYNEETGESKTLHYQDQETPLVGRFFQALSWSEYCNCLLIGSNNGINQYYPDEDRWESWEFSDAIDAGTGIWQVIQFADGMIWAGTGVEEESDDGLLILNPQSGEWQVIKTGNGLLGNTVTDIAQTSDGRIWVSQFTAGLSEMNLEGEIIQHYTLENSLMPFNSIDDLEVDQFDRIWAATKGGLMLFDPIGNSWEQFNIGEELGGTSEFLFNLSFGQSNDLWASSDNGSIHWFMPIVQADLEVDLSGPSRIDYTNLSPMQYTLVITNTGEMAARTDLSFQFPISSTVGAFSLPTEPENNGNISIGVLDPIESVTYSFELIPTQGWQPNQLFSVVVAADANGRETTISNNRATVQTQVVQPDQIDLSVELQGPSILANSGIDELRIIIINRGDKASLLEQINLIVPDQVSVIDAFPQALNGTNTTWNVPPLNPGELYEINFQIDFPTESGNGKIELSAVLPQASDESYLANNQATIAVPFNLGQIETLILVSPNRLSNQYGASTVLEELYRLAEHDAVKGLVINLEEEAGMGSELVDFDTFPSDWEQANQTAESIKSLIDSYIQQLPTVQYIVLAGGDSIIPHYRIDDENPTEWKERNYAIQVVENERTFSAMLANKMLTDDYYAAERPLVPQSFFWATDSPIYLPSISIGRLAETPEEITKVTQAFWDNNGVFSLDSALIGGDDFLAGDLVSRQCDLLETAGFTLTCADSDETFSSAILNTNPDSIWTSFHSNHHSMGLFGSAIEAAAFRELDGTLPMMGTIGCHAGLNVIDHGLVTDFDFVQGMALNGGTMIGSTSYTYGSSWDVNYTESLMEIFMHRLLTSNNESAGHLLRQAKQDYFNQRPWFDHLDAKTLMPMTYYGLPMARFALPEGVRRKAVKTENASQLDLENNIVSLKFEASDFIRNETADGTIFAYKGETINQHRLPIQPLHLKQVPFLKDGEEIKGILITDAMFNDIENFDPVVNESWAMGAQRQLDVVEPILEKAEWDRELPAGLIITPEREQIDATISFVPGLFNADTNVERLFNQISLELIYGDLEAIAPSYIDEIKTDQVNGKSIIRIKTTGNGSDRVTILYELDSSWRTIELTFDASMQEWSGSIPQEIERYHIQIVSQTGDVNKSGWLLTNPLSTFSRQVFLPVVTR